MISNQDNYLFLKQILTIIQAQRNGVEVDLRDEPLSPEITRHQALNRLQFIEDDFTIPRFVDNNEVTTVNYQHFTELLEMMIQGDDGDETGIQDLIMDVSQPEKLHKAIMEYPDVKIWVDEHYKNVQDTIRFDINQDIITKGAMAVDKALNSVREWVDSTESPFPLARAIVLLNCVQLIDEMYQFGNDRFIGC